MCGADMCDLFLKAVGVETSFPFTINPPSMNFWIVCRIKDRGGSGCSRRWSRCFKFCLFGGRPPEVTVCSVFYRGCFGLGFGVRMIGGRELYKG